MIRWKRALVTVAGCAILTACSSTPTGTPRLVQVGYFVEGAAPTANVTLQADSGTRALGEVGLPLTNGAVPGFYVTVSDGSHVFVTARGQGRLSCRIEIDGKPTAKTVGNRGTVTCEGTA